MTTPSTTVAPTTSPTVIIQTTPGLLRSIKELCDAQLKIEGKFQAGADACRLAATSQGYSRQQAAQMLKLAYEEAGQDTKKKAPDISKILSLAYPASEESAKALADAKVHNLNAAPAEKIGVNDQLRIARDKTGATTATSILEERKEEAAAKTRGAQNGGAPRVPGSSPSTTPSTFTKEEAHKQLMHIYTSIRTIGKMTEEQADTLIAEVVAEYNEAISGDADDAG